MYSSSACAPACQLFQAEPSMCPHLGKDTHIHPAVCGDAPTELCFCSEPNASQQAAAIYKAFNSEGKTSSIPSHSISENRPVCSYMELIFSPLFLRFKIDETNLKYTEQKVTAHLIFPYPQRSNHCFFFPR